ncbi:MAG: cytochrome c family protein [Myxococcaceae bacterium]|jgi:Flp pilus assembly protein TadD|nr:cytochrome c family protein [Myxococcaceae bacterium]
MTALLVALVFAAEPVLPEDRSPWAPGLLVQDGKGAAPSASHDDAKVCGSCHLDVAAQWKTSAHAFASFNNPLYRVAVERTRSEVGFSASRMCAGCHDLALLTSGGMDRPIAPTDPRAHAGVSCTSCHSATHARLDGNGSLTLRSDSALPETIEAATVKNHKERMVSPILRTAQLCAGCHRSFLGEQTGNAAAFFGMDDFGAWQKSAYNHSTAERPDTVTAQDCRGCHMPKEDAVLGDVAAKQGKITSHRFLGSHTTLAAMRKDAETVRRVQAFLKDSVRVEISGARLREGPFIDAPAALPLTGGAAFEVDVVVFNERVGHRFPGSVMDNQGTRLEVELLSATGRVLAVADRHELRSEVVDVTGEPVHERQTHKFVSAVWNHTVPARDARAVRIGFEVPLSLAPTELPLSVRARVVHQTRLPELGALACRDGATDRGRAFLEAADTFLGQRLDPCVDAPRTVVASQTLTFDASTRVGFDAAWRRALALSVSLQEYLGDAEQAFAQARALATSKPEEGRALWGLAAIAGRRGQTDAALAFLAEAEARLGQTAATWKTRGDLYAQVWRWPLAAEAYAQAAALAPEDVTVWQQLAMSEASAGRYPQALAAAQRGIALFPRDADCLRVQALALMQLGAPKQVQERSLAAALQWRVPDDGPAAKGRCSKRIAGCADRRNPVPFYQAVPTGPLATAR